MRKHRPSSSHGPSPPPSTRLSLGVGHSSFTPLPDGPRSLPSPRDGPRSLPSAPTKRHARHWHALGAFDGPSYSSFGRLAGRDDSPALAASVSLPSAPNVDAEGVRPTTPHQRHTLHSPLRNNHLASHSTPASPAPPDPSTLTRSDSLLNRARRYFSLPTSLKRTSKGPLVPPTAPRPDDDGPSSLRMGALAYRRSERRQRRDPHSAGGGSAMAGHAPRRSSKTPAEVGALRPAAAAAARREEPFGDDDASRVRWLEDQLAAARVKVTRQRRKIAQLEDELARDRQSRPALEALLQSAMRHFEAKEAALKHTIARLDHDYATVLAEKNEAMRLLTAFVGRGGRSPPASFSSVSEAGTESTHYKASRRALSMDTFRRSSPNSNPRGTIFAGFEAEQGGERVAAE